MVCGEQAQTLARRRAPTPPLHPLPGPMLHSGMEWTAGGGQGAADDVSQPQQPGAGELQAGGGGAVHAAAPAHCALPGGVHRAAQHLHHRGAGGGGQPAHPAARQTGVAAAPAPAVRRAAGHRGGHRRCHGVPAPQGRAPRPQVPGKRGERGGFKEGVEEWGGERLQGPARSSGFSVAGSGEGARAPGTKRTAALQMDPGPAFDAACMPGHPCSPPRPRHPHNPGSLDTPRRTCSWARTAGPWCVTLALPSSRTARL